MSVRSFRELLHAPGLWIGTAAFVVVTGAVWLTFVTDHSLVQRYRWQQELTAVNARNRELERQIFELEVKLKDVGSPQVIEEIAREQYGMRRPGETVYRVVGPDSVNAPAPVR